MVKNGMGFVIQDLRENKVYFDDKSFLRNFEKMLEEEISFEKAVEKYPNIIDCRN